MEARFVKLEALAKEKEILKNIYSLLKNSSNEPESVPAANEPEQMHE